MFCRSWSSLLGRWHQVTKPQQDVAMLEKIVVEHCQSEVKTESPLGLLIRGPDRSRTFPAGLALWKPQELAGQRDVLYINDRRPTVSCKQVTTRDRSALERPDLSCTYLAHHEPESGLITIVIIVIVGVCLLHMLCSPLVID